MDQALRELDGKGERIQQVSRLQGKRAICPVWSCSRGKLPAANRRPVNSAVAASHVSCTQFIGADADAES